MIMNPVIAGGGSKPEWVNGRAELTRSGKFMVGTFTIPRNAGEIAIVRAIVSGSTYPELAIVKNENQEEVYNGRSDAELSCIASSETELTMEYRDMGIISDTVDYAYIVV